MEHPPRSSERRWGPAWVGLVAILAGAAALRLVGVQYGLPFALLNPDEQSIVPRAWKMVHCGGLDPHWFDYPSLLLYVLAPFQAWEGGPSYLAARLVLVALALGGIAAAWWLGRAAYGNVAGFVAAAATAVETTHVAYSRMAVTDVPLTLGVTATLALLVTGRLELAGLAAGVAASFKYPGALLLVPIVAVGWGAWRRVAVAAALAVAGFAFTSPYVFVHPGQAGHDYWRTQRLARSGWLGFEHDHWAGIAFADRLWHGLGPVLLIALAGLVVALAVRRRADLALGVFAVAYFASLLVLHAHFDRYTLPLVPVLGALAGRLRALAPVTLLLLVVPLTWSIRDTKRLTLTDTRVVAHRWIQSNLPRGAGVAEESSLPPLPGFRVISLPLPRPGRIDLLRNVTALRAAGIRYVVISGAVADRVLAAREDYPVETQFYDELRRAGRIYYLGPGHGLTGPWVAVYHV